MEVLNLLEQKIAYLIELIKNLKVENLELKKSLDQALADQGVLKDQIDMLQTRLLEKPQEIGVAKEAIDELIRNIDILIEHEQG